MAYSKKQIEQIFNEILSIIEDGKSLRYALKETQLSKNTFYKWINENEEKRERYAQACILRADSLFDEIIDIADQIDRKDYNRDRLRIDARKWALSKMNPKKYGDKIDVTSGDEKIEQNSPSLNGFDSHLAMRGTCYTHTFYCIGFSYRTTTLLVYCLILR